MTSVDRSRTINGVLSSARTLAGQTYARAAGAPLVPGNTARILKDAKENYPAWLEALASAKKTIHFETYISRTGGIRRPCRHIASRSACKPLTTADPLQLVGRSPAIAALQLHPSVAGEPAPSETTAGGDSLPG